MKHRIFKTHTHGDMALCNLASVNLVEWRALTDEEKDALAYTVVASLESAIAAGQCPISEGQVTNELYRYIGVGVMNSAQAMALEGITIDTQEAAEWFDEVMDDLSYRMYYSSMVMATELGAPEGFKHTKWAEGLTPVHESLRCYPKAWELTEYGRTFVESGKLERWTQLGRMIAKNGIRHLQVMSIAPTANSGKAINATESTEPVAGLIFKEEGVFNVTSLAPNLKKCIHYYKPAFECSQKNLVLNAIVRQKYLDQAQSITLYLKKADSAKELTHLHNFGFENGIKTFYYIKQQKTYNDKDDCVACAV